MKQDLNLHEASILCINIIIKVKKERKVLFTSWKATIKYFCILHWNHLRLSHFPSRKCR